MVNYQNGKIYKIYSYQTDDVYYGSTTQKLCRRMVGHRTDHKQGTGITSKDILKFDDAKIELVEVYSCNNKEELHKREGWYIKNNDCVNKHIAGRTRKEWRDDNKEKIKKNKADYQIKNKERLNKISKDYHDANREAINKQAKEYNIKNKDVIAEKSKQYRKDNKDDISKRRKIYRDSNKEKLAVSSKISREKNKEKHKESKKQYQLMHKVEISNRAKKTMICECGSTHRIYGKDEHLKSKKHQAFINQ